MAPRDFNERQRVTGGGIGVESVNSDLYGRFAVRARESPDAIAATFGDVKLPYAELRRRANLLADHLIAHGVGPDVPVAVALDRSLDLPVAVLGVLAAGGAYVPIDPNYPAERVGFMLGDCGATILITNGRTGARLPTHGLATINLDIDARNGSDADPNVETTDDDLGYIIYTSGSTGRPKGVAMRRGALGNLIDWQIRHSAVGVGETTLQYASLSFDVSFQELFATWASGGTLALIAEELRHDPPALLRFIDDRRIARLFLPVVALHQIADAAAAGNLYPPSLREIITAGEALQITPSVVRFFEQLPKCSLHNQYGPSETHVVTAHTLGGPPKGWPVLPPIGKPIDNCTIEIVGTSLEPVANGDQGELLLGGACLARGYTNRVDLTDERFIVHTGSRFYRTGDLVRRTADGVLEFLGRADDQVKIRGFRVELGEVEAALRAHPALRAAAVAAHEAGPGERFLVGYVVPAGDAPRTDELQQFLADRLPDYMTPQQFVVLADLPLTPSGKVDRRRLPAPERRRPELRHAFAAPRTAVEQTIAAAWCDLLRLDRVGIDDGFFELGGNSLTLTRVHARLQTALERTIPVAHLLQHATIRKLAAALEDRPTPSRVAPKPARVSDSAVAVVGMAGRFPGADDIEQFWRNLCDGVESISVLSDAELLAAGVAPEVVQSPDYVKARGLLRNAETFDAAFFGYPPREAELLDPQHRVFLETAWTALEHAGCDPARSGGPVAVFAGSSPSTYLMANVCADGADLAAMMSGYQSGNFPALFGNDKDYLATRVAYELDLRGPAVSVQTACSTALVAVAQACDSLLAGRCRVALAGGVSITVPRMRGYQHQEGAMVSPDGHCRAFDAAAAGTVFGEGVGVVVLKRLADARADGDSIYAVVRGTGVTNDGAAKMSFTAPSSDGQAAAIRQALDQAGFDAGSIGYIEAHGTATPLGDPVEIAGLTAAFQVDSPSTGSCAIGSVKTNVGHLEAAAGAAGLIKTVLALHRRQLPPTLHFERSNPQIGLEQSPFRVVDRLTDWAAGATPRRAGVSSFGVGGTNAHVVLEEAPVAEGGPTARSSQLLVLSAKTPAALNNSTRNLIEFLREQPQTPLADAAYTLQVGRQAFAHRRAVAAATVPEAIAALENAASGEAVAGRAVAFLFPGQGSQVVHMGRGLYESEPVFRETLDRCCEILKQHLALDLREVLYPERGPAEEVAARTLQQTGFTQPALFAVQYSLARLAVSWGVTPAAYFGHSIGEYVAATLAGVFELEDALSLVATRGRLIQSMPAGAMIAVRLGEAELTPILTTDLDLAAVNGPRQCVVSGPVAAIDAFAKSLHERGIESKRLATSHAFHSRMLEPMLGQIEAAVAAVRRAPPVRRFISCVTGKWITPEQATDPAYWASQVRRVVRCADCLSALSNEGFALWELGPGTTLANLARSVSPGTAVAASALSASNDGGDVTAVLRSLGRLWMAGVDVDWPKLHAPARPTRIALPTYPFDRKRYWIEPKRFEPRAPGVVAEPSSQVAEPRVARSDIGDAAQNLADVQTLFAELSGVAPQALDPRATYFELGFDSLGLTQVVLRIQNRFGVRISFRQLLEDLPTPDALARYLALQAPDRPVRSVPPTDVPVSESPQGFGALAPIDRSADDEWKPGQRRFIAELVERYARRTAGSKRHVQDFRSVHADPRTVSGFHKLWKEMVYPLVVDRSAGSKFWDIDGNEYIDLLNGFGPDLFGHSPPFVVEAVADQLRRGYEVGPMSPLAGEVAKLICDMTGMERASFVCTGSEAVQAALRAARTVTGRDTVALFARDYHGNFDEVLVRPNPGRATASAPGIPASAVGNVLVLEYGSEAALAKIRERANELAAVLVEPIQSRRPELQPREFLHDIRRITASSGAAMIFDEVITGFRLDPGGAQAFYGVSADLATYGKVIGGGMPFGVVAGRGAYMDAFDGGPWQFGDDSAPEAGRTFFAGTFVRHPLALAAAKAALIRLRDAGPALQADLNAKATRLVAELDDVCVRNGVPLKVVHCGSVLFFRVLDHSKAASLLFYLLREKGVYILEGFPSYLSTAHSADDLRAIVAAFRAGVAELREAGFFETAPARFAPSLNGHGESSATVPLTEAQRELWLAAQMGPDASCAYNESCHVRLRGRLDVAALHSALQALVDRHDALRATISPDGEHQQFAKTLAIDLPLENISENRDRIAEILDAEDRTPFDLVRGPLLRAKLVRLADDEHVFVLTAHHIACDGWAYDIVLRELGVFYSALAAGTMPALPPAASFADYAGRQFNWLHSPESDAIDSWWRLRFADPPPPLELPTDRARPVERSYAGARLSGTLGPELSGAVRAEAARLGRTPYALLFAAYQSLLSRLAATGDIAVGIPTAGQALEDGGSLVGHCVHFLPVRIKIESEGSFSDLAGSTHAVLADAIDHQRFTYSRLIRLLALRREGGRAPLLSATFNLDPEVTGLAFAGLDVEIAKNPKHFVNFDLHFNLVEQGDEYLIECEYATELFDAATIDRWIGHYRTLIAATVGEPVTPVSGLPLWSQQERRQVLEDWNATATKYPADQCVHQLFEAQVRRTPDAVALEFESSAISYRDLNCRANRLAHRLREADVQPDDLVAVCASRSFDLIAGLLAVLKAGGAYVPLNPQDPPARLAQLLETARPKAILAEQGILDASVVIRLDSAHDGDSTDLPCVSKPDDLAYVMFTSGSTGEPKGVAVPHRAIARLLFGVDYAAFGPQRVFGQLAPLAFDASTFEIWGALLHGGRCALYPGRAPSPAELGDFLRRHHVDTLFLTTGLFNTIVDTDLNVLAGITQLLTGGEAISTSHVRRALAALPTTQLTHVYGPTETTTFATSWPVPREIPADARTLPIGRPIANTTAYVLDTSGQPVPIGVTGELFLGGPGLARGYLHQPELTEQRFVQLPSLPRLYRTGDRVRWLSDGTLEFVGRVDRQVKVRGFRIEPGEIEAVLLRQPGVGAAVVEPWPDVAGGLKLAAYVSPIDSSPPIEVEKLRAALRTELPEFMQPAHLIALPRMPVSATGKLDRKALPPPAADQMRSRTSVAPRDDLERRLVELWQAALGVRNVGVTDDFFALGGHSLLAARLFARIREQFGRELPLAVLFRSPTVAGIAEVLRGKPADAPAPLVVALRTGGARAPLVCIPGVGGHVFSFRELADRLGVDRPVYGLHARGVDGASPPHRRIEPMAADFLAELRAVAPDGPYHLIGYSLGGLVVFEMARQLTALGVPVGLIAMLDAHAPGHPRKLPVAKRAHVHMRKFLAQGWRGRAGYVRDRIAHRFGKPDLETSDYEAQIRGTADLSPTARTVIEAHLEALHHYRPEPFAGRVQLFRSREQEAWSEMYVPDYTMGWGELVEGGLDLFWVPGGHLEMFHPAALDTLTRQLGDWLRKAQ